MIESKILPARIIKYNTDKQTATVKISAEKVYSNIDKELGLKKWEVMYDVPVHTASGGIFGLTFPIVEGDTCLMVFSQVGYDHWLVEDRDEAGLLYGQHQPHLKRMFSQDDGFCLVGFNTLPRAFSGVSSTDTVWRNRDLTSCITIREDGSINIKKNTTNIEIKANDNIEINAPLTTINGNVDINGNLTHVGNYNLNGNIIHTGIVSHVGSYTLTGSLNASGTVTAGTLVFKVGPTPHVVTPHP